MINKGEGVIPSPCVGTLVVADQALESEGINALAALSLVIDVHLLFRPVQEDPPDLLRAGRGGYSTRVPASSYSTIPVRYSQQMRESLPPAGLMTLKRYIKSSTIRA